MRISYTYKNYPNCPRATEYSHSVESASAYAGMFIGIFSFAAAATFLASTFYFFGDYKWGLFLCGITFALAMALIDFYYFIIRPNNTSCELDIILIEESDKSLPKEIVQEFCESLRSEARKKNKEAFKDFFPVFLAAFCDAIALIAGIKGVYFLCHKQGGLFLLIGAIVAICVFSCLIWKFSNKNNSEASIESIQNHSPTSSSTYPDDGIMFCRKCGATTFPDSKFCSKCGSQVR